MKPGESIRPRIAERWGLRCVGFLQQPPPAPGYARHVAEFASSSWARGVAGAALAAARRPSFLPVAGSSPPRLVQLCVSPVVASTAARPPTLLRLDSSCRTIQFVRVDQQSTPPPPAARRGCQRRVASRHYSTPDGAVGLAPAAPVTTPTLTSRYRLSDSITLCCARKQFCRAAAGGAFTAGSTAAQPRNKQYHR